MISVKPMAGDEWQVTVKACVPTHHRVRVIQADLERFATGCSTEDLLHESFRFLLQREPTTSILDSCDLPVIKRHFPTCEEEIRKLLREAS